MSSMQQYFIGLPITKYNNFKTIVDRILNGSMMTEPRAELEKISETDSDVQSSAASIQVKLIFMVIVNLN